MSGKALAGAIALACTLAGAAHADTLQWVDYIAGEFTDISGAPVLNLGGDEVGSVTMTVSNPIFSAGTVWVGNNGGIGFVDPPDDFLTNTNYAIPSNNAFGGGQAVLGLWDNLDDVGTIHVDETPAALIIQWEDKTFEGSDDTCRFQIKIFDIDGLRPQPIYAQIIYADIEQPRAAGGGSATIGYQDGGAGHNDAQWSFDAPGAVSNGTVLTLVPEPGAALLLICGMLAYRQR
ncbi:MAG: hypothetical protein KKB50_02745 [Planctomycetes bacterium]|nr:hypothetical protein [Planctomycetota bacterium]